MLIAQITDLHYGAGDTPMFNDNRARLTCMLEELEALSTPPDFVLATGDLTENGDADSYRELKAMLDASPFKIYPAMGNHDLRESFREVYGDEFFTDGYVQYAIEADALRVLVLDTLEEGRHGGALGFLRAEWLHEKLAERPDTPTVIALHHPPIQTGIAWMTPEPDEPWIRRLQAVVEASPQVVRIVAGHIHRPINAMWAGKLVSVCPATAAQLELDLKDIDVMHPDGRPLIVDEPPAYALHHWNGRSLTTHVGQAGDFATIVRYEGQMARAMFEIMDLNPDGSQLPPAKSRNRPRRSFFSGFRDSES